MASVIVWGLGLVLNPFILWVLFLLVTVINEDILLTGIQHLRSRIGSTMSGRVQEGNLASLVSPVSHLLRTTGPFTNRSVVCTCAISSWACCGREEYVTGNLLGRVWLGEKNFSLPSRDHLPKEGQIPTWVRKLMCRGDRLTKALTTSIRKLREEMLLHEDRKDKEEGGDWFKGRNLS